MKSTSPSAHLHIPSNVSGLDSYSGDPHHHLPVGSGADPLVIGSQLAKDVQDGVSTVVVQNSS